MNFILPLAVFLSLSILSGPLAAKQPAEMSPISLHELAARHYDGRDLRIVKTLAKNSQYYRYLITYRSGQLKISGIMNVPAGKGPFPVVVTNHGYIPTKIYTIGRGLKREQDYLARSGFVVLHPDYRNHGWSDKDPQSEANLRLGYIEDVINAVEAVKNSNFEFLGKEKIGMLGHSLGGGICLNIMVAMPDLIDAFVLYAPVSANYIDNYNRWIKKERPEFIHHPPEFWRNLSAINFIDNITAPIMIHHGTTDKSCPVIWSDRLAAVLKKKEKNFIYYKYIGEGHEFSRAWPQFMRRNVEFFREYLK